MQQQQPSSGTQNQQGVMPQPPEVMTTKDHLYISDMLSWNLLAMKKMNFYATQCQDPEVQTKLQQAGQMHERHYKQLLQELEAHANQPTIGKNMNQ
jgi:hypothetical protein